MKQQRSKARKELFTMRMGTGERARFERVAKAHNLTVAALIRTLLARAERELTSERQATAA